MKVRLFAAVSLFSVTASLQASAQQPWIKDRRYGEGMGVRAGNLEFHPSIAAEFGYDSNYFQRADDGDPDEDPISFLRFRLTPSFSVKTLGGERREGLGGGPAPSVDFSAGAHLAYNELIATSPDDIDAETGKTHSEVASDQRHVDAGAGFRLHVLPQRPFSFDMYGDWVRTVEPSNDVVPENAFDRDTIRLGAGVNWRPGGGLFDWRLGYELGLHLFERDVFQLYNNAQHAILTRGAWRFLPKTALRYDAEYRLIRFANETSQSDGETIQARLGLNGLITYHFALLAMGGWAASFYRDQDTGAGTVTRRNYDDFVAQAEIKWFLMAQQELEGASAPVGLSTIALGYVRNFATSYLGAFYRRDRGYLNFSYFIGGVAIIGVEGGLSHITYPDVVAPGGAVATPSFWENRIDAQLFGEYRLSDIFALNTTLIYTESIVEDDIRPRPDTVSPGENIEFQRFQAWLGARLFW